jgi:hypothetical protein
MFESVFSWVLFFATWSAFGYPLTIGGIFIDKVFPLLANPPFPLPQNAHQLIQWDFLLGSLSIYLIEFFELIVIPILWIKYR